MSYFILYLIRKKELETSVIKQTSDFILLQEISRWRNNSKLFSQSLES